jgi:hypothetical protein
LKNFLTEFINFAVSSLLFNEKFPRLHFARHEVSDEKLVIRLEDIFCNLLHDFKVDFKYIFFHFSNEHERIDETS